MSKIKMRCITCGKWFQSANAKEVTCPDCTQRARREKLASKNAASPSNKPAPRTFPGNQNRSPIPPKPKPKSTHSGTNQWLDSIHDIKVSQPDRSSTQYKPYSPTPRDNRNGPGGYRHSGGPTSPNNYRDERGFRGEPGNYRRPANYRVGSGTTNTPLPLGQPPYEVKERGLRRGPHPDRPYPNTSSQNRQKPKQKIKNSGSRPASPKPKRAKTPPPQPFIPTPEQVAQVERRYQELATPHEFDGIRTQIATELGIPKKAVKKIVKEFRARQDIPSWWELQTYKGSTEELERIKAAYEPYLPVPPVGVHKKLAEELSLNSGTVYQAIKAIRLEMNLPQYNDPSFHEEELAAIQQAHNKQSASQEQPSSSSTLSGNETNRSSATTISSSSSKDATGDTSNRTIL